MFKIFVSTLFVISVIAYSSAKPQQASSGSSNPDAQATVVTSSYTDDAAGNFAYNYEISNQIKFDTKGEPKQITDPEGKQQQGEVQQGSYSFVAPDGQTYTVEWVADENGFQPKGAHIPTIPPPSS